jgi:antitoxin MazE
MKTKLRTLQGELAIPIPAELASSLKMHGGSEVDVVVEDGKIIIRPIGVPQYSLADLLSQVTDENRHELVDWGRPVGGEIW